MKRAYRHLFFDLDHTLWDFHHNSQRTIHQLYQRFELKDKLPACEPAIFYERYLEINDGKWQLYRLGRLTKGEVRSQRFYETFQSFGLPNRELSEAFQQAYLAHCPRQRKLLPGALETLGYLKERYTLHIITNGFADTQRIKLQESGLANFFTQVFSSELIGVNKPAAGIFIASLKASGATRKDSLMIGDSLAVDVLGAQNCGIDQVYFNPARHSHTASPTFEVVSLPELRSFL